MLGLHGFKVFYPAVLDTCISFFIGQNKEFGVIASRAVFLQAKRAGIQ